MKTEIQTLRRSCLLLLYLLFFFSILKVKMPMLSMVMLSMVWYLRTKDRSFIFVTLLFIIILIPRAYTGIPQIQKAYIIEVHHKYAVARWGFTKVMIYTKQPLYYDSVISLNGSFEKIVSSPSFFGFDFGAFCRRRGICYSFSGDAVTLYQLPSVRSFLQKQTLRLSDETARSYVQKVLLGISSDLIPDGFLSDSGIALSGVILLYDQILQYWLYPDTRRKVIRILTAVLLIIYRFPVPLVIRFLDGLLYEKIPVRRERTALCLSAVLLFEPGCAFTPSFLMPALIRIVSLEKQGQRSRRIFLSAFLQSILFSEVKIFHILLFRNLNMLSGLLWNFGVLYCLCGYDLFLFLIIQCDRLAASLFSFSLPGSPLGPGLPFFLLLLLCFRSSKHQNVIACLLLFSFLLTGMFHPFAEVCFLNVGQGDSILIRSPFSLSNVMVDTGKPSAARQVNAALKARGIRRIDTLFVTHDDSDHSGNVSFLQEHYEVRETVTEHFDEKRSGRLSFHDLNEIVNDDKNQSSLVLYTKLNGLTYLLTGDADEVTEREMVRKYPALHADVLKVSHHGSRTGSCGIFLDTVRCSLAVISCGDYAIYHHPDEMTLQRLLSRHIPFLVTREDGDISVLSFFRLNLLITSSGKIAIIGS